METNHDLFLLLGRLDGKVDTLVQLHASTTARLDQIDGRLATVEQDVTTMKASNVSNRSWWSSLTSVVALAVSAVSAYFGIKN